MSYQGLYVLSASFSHVLVLKPVAYLDGLSSDDVVDLDPGINTADAEPRVTCFGVLGPCATAVESFCLEKG